MNDEHMQIDSFAPVIEMDVLANEETSGSEQYSSPMQDDYSEDEDSFAGIVYLIYMNQVIAKHPVIVVVVKTWNCPQKDF